MNQDAFIAWAMDAARTVEERYTVEILVEDVMHAWNVKHQTGQFEGFEAIYERNRQRYFNPAYVPGYSPTGLHRAAEIWAERKFWWVMAPYQNRPIRDLSALRFLTSLEEVKIAGSEIADLSPLADLPNLRVLEFASKTCEDFHPLARCRQLHSLSLKLEARWPKLAGLEQLEQLENLNLTGNLIAFAPGLTWPRVRRGGLTCAPLAVRSVRELPQFPACEILLLGGVDDLDGIAAMPKLRNLTLTGPVRDFSPLTVLDQLTCLTYNGAEPLDIRPLTRLARLHFAAFTSQHNWNIDKAPPRDYMPLLDAPQLRELDVTGCPPVDAEVANLNNLFPAWDDLFLRPQPRPLPAVEFIVAPHQLHPHWPDVALEPEDHGVADNGLRACEGRWVAKYVHRLVTAKVGGHPEWGEVRADGQRRSFTATITCYTLIDKLPLMLEAMREAIARLRGNYQACFMVCLKAPAMAATPEQVELEKEFQAQRDKEEHERYHREHQEYLDRLYRYDLKKQAGETINPKDFDVPPSEPMSDPPWETEDEDEDDSNDGEGGVAVKEKPDPPPSWCDDAHPLADEYGMLGAVNLSEIWVISYARDIAAYLLGRQPDREIPEDPK